MIWAVCLVIVKRGGIRDVLLRNGAESVRDAYKRAQDVCRSSVVTLHMAKITGKYEQSGWTI